MHAAEMPVHLTSKQLFFDLSAETSAVTGYFLHEMRGGWLTGDWAHGILARRGIGLCRAPAREHRVAIIHEGQLIPVRPLPGRNLRFSRSRS